jgi:RsiW-degrading membrane proteinase PrsW (M82 family)
LANFLCRLFKAESAKALSFVSSAFTISSFEEIVTAIAIATFFLAFSALRISCFKPVANS